MLLAIVPSKEFKLNPAFQSCNLNNRNPRETHATPHPADLMRNVEIPIVKLYAAVIRVTLVNPRNVDRSVPSIRIVPRHWLVLDSVVFHHVTEPVDSMRSVWFSLIIRDVNVRFLKFE